MIALDTSVVVRLLTGDTPEEFAAARRVIGEAHAVRRSVIVTDLVVAETWLAMKFHYGADEADTRARLREMLTSGTVQPEPGSGALEALATGRGKAGFIDRLIHARHGQLRATTVTFDADQAKLAHAVRVTVS